MALKKIQGKPGHLADLRPLGFPRARESVITGDHFH
jgi:hypothetical protein